VAGSDREAEAVRLLENATAEAVRIRRDAEEDARESMQDARVQARGRLIASWVLHGPMPRVSRHRLLKAVNGRDKTESWPRTPECRPIASSMLHGV
jgi:hypothetical protein